MSLTVNVQWYSEQESQHIDHKHDHIDLDIALGIDPRDSLIQKEEGNQVFEGADDDNTLSSIFMMAMDDVCQSDIGRIDLTK